ncbi:hypothetical protein H9P43_009213 [Blastocladiella emersonii ATCC 22665]|nr:hypothetical protein H9P43_009213 [Blastocladiella emersonii ATCC 22665]
MLQKKKKKKKKQKKPKPVPEPNNARARDPAAELFGYRWSPLIKKKWDWSSFTNAERKAHRRAFRKQQRNKTKRQAKRQAKRYEVVRFGGSQHGAPRLESPPKGTPRDAPRAVSPQYQHAHTPWNDKAFAQLEVRGKRRDCISKRVHRYWLFVNQGPPQRNYKVHRPRCVFVVSDAVREVDPAIMAI